MELFSKELSFYGWRAKDPKDLFEQLKLPLEQGNHITPGWLDAVYLREKTYPTGLSLPGILDFAIPHTDPQFIQKPYVALIRLAEPVRFEAMAGAGDDVAAELVINLGVKRDGGQVAMLQKLMNLLSHKATVEELMAAKNASELYQSFMHAYKNLS